MGSSFLAGSVKTAELVSVQASLLQRRLFPERYLRVHMQLGPKTSDCHLSRFAGQVELMLIDLWVDSRENSLSIPFLH